MEINTRDVATIPVGYLRKKVVTITAQNGVTVPAVGYFKERNAYLVKISDAAKLPVYDIILYHYVSDRLRYFLSSTDFILVDESADHDETHIQVPVHLMDYTFTINKTYVD